MSWSEDTLMAKIGIEVTNFGLNIPKDASQLRNRKRKVNQALFKTLQGAWFRAANMWARSILTNIDVETGQSAGTVVPLIRRTKRFGIGPNTAVSLIKARRKRLARVAAGLSGQPSTRTIGSGIQTGRSRTFSLRTGSPQNPRFVFTFRIVTLQWAIREPINPVIPKANEAFLRTLLQRLPDNVLDAVLPIMFPGTFS